MYIHRYASTRMRGGLNVTKSASYVMRVDDGWSIQLFDRGNLGLKITKYGHVYAICGQPEVAGDVIFNRIVKAIEG